MILYKYRGCSEYTDKIFTDQEVYLSTAEGLNDPFECTIQEIAKEWIDQQVNTMIEGHLMGFIHAFFNARVQPFYGLPYDQAKRVMKKFKKIPSMPAKYEYFRKFAKERTGHYPSDPRKTFANFDKQLQNAGIFSLSEDPSITLMWSYYAQDTKGIAIGFEVTPNSKLADNDHCVKVSYSDTLPSFEGKGFLQQVDMYLEPNGFLRGESKVSFSDPTFKAAISTKSPQWSHEKEWRYIEEKPGTYPHPGPIKEVVFGVRCTEEDRLRYQQLVKTHLKHPVEFFEIKKIPNTNQIVRVPL